MLKYTLTRLAAALPVLVIASLLAFSLGVFGPSDPVYAIGGMNIRDAAQYAEVEHRLGLDRPFLVQFGDYLSSAIQGDLGVSWKKARPVWTLVASTLPITLQLAAAATFVTAIVGIPLGLLAASRRDGWMDRGIVNSAVMGAAVPSYVMAPALMVLLVLQLKWLPVDVGWSGLFRLEMVIPVLTMALGPLALIIRQVRNGNLEVRNTDYAQFAVAKGLTRRRVAVRHILPNALTPVISQLGVIFGFLLTGAIFVEQIFGIPGFGSLIVDGVVESDFPLLIGSVIVAVGLILVVNLATDLLYGIIDPRVRLAKKATE